MDRARRLQEVWSWLPAFRAVAEQPHLPTASRALGVTPSALSRSVRLLEEALGRPLFDRVGRGLRLNADGEQLLDAVRAAMRQLDDGLDGLGGAEARGPLRIAVTTALIPILVQPALAALRREWPRVVPHLLAPGDTDAVNQALVTGALDLALLQHPRPHPELRVEKLVDLDYGVYCGPGHALYDRPLAGVDEVLRHEFVGPTLHEADRFPPEMRHTVTLRVAHMVEAMGFCAAGEYLAVLPKAVVDGWTGPRLFRIPGLRLPPGAVYLARRRVLARPNPAIESLCRALHALG